jgi:diguanylate cyclase (GGDEF)-like protein
VQNDTELLDSPVAHPGMRARPRILVMDDEAELLNYVRRLLHGRFDVSVLADSTRAEASVAEQKPTLLLLDYLMPRRDGLDVCRTLRADAANDLMPILFLTAIDSEDLRIKGYEAGADDFIIKPFDGAELVAKLEVWTRLAERSAELLRKNRQLEELALRDGLTGLFSRRHILEVLDREMARFVRYDSPLSLLMIDIDDFKSINDRYGHSAGDQAIKSVARHIRRCLRSTDAASRYGGDEFMIVLPNTDGDALDSICQKLQAGPVECFPRERMRIGLSLSIGAASALPGQETSTPLIDAADLAMLVAKRAGKGRYHIAHQDTTGGGEVDIFRRLHETRRGAREAVCRIIHALLSEVGREGDVVDSGLDIMLELADRLGERLELDEEKRAVIRDALHIVNVERLGLSAEIACQSGPLDQKHRRALAATIRRNVNLLRNTGFLEDEAEVIESVRECWDGSGTPKGLQGPAIPLAARVVRLVAGYGAAYRDRDVATEDVRRAAWETVMGEKGVAYDPRLVERLREVLDAYYADGHDTGSGALLAIEDHPPLRRVLEQRLSKIGYRMRMASSLAEARTHLSDGPLRAVLLDLMLQDGDGLDLCRELRQNEATADLPVVVVSARCDAESLHEARQAGATAYVTKPIPFEKLLRLLAGCSRHGGAENEFPILRA